MNFSCNVSEDGGFSYLSLDGVTDDDIGEYEAVAKNDLGQVVSRSEFTKASINMFRNINNITAKFWL